MIQFLLAFTISEISPFQMFYLENLDKVVEYNIHIYIYIYIYNIFGYFSSNGTIADVELHSDLHFQDHKFSSIH